MNPLRPTAALIPSSRAYFATAFVALSASILAILLLGTAPQTAYLPIWSLIGALLGLLTGHSGLYFATVRTRQRALIAIIALIISYLVLGICVLWFILHLPVFAQ